MICEHDMEGYMQSLLEKNENKNLTFIFYNFLHLD